MTKTILALALLSAAWLSMSGCADTDRGESKEPATSVDGKQMAPLGGAEKRRERAVRAPADDVSPLPLSLEWGGANLESTSFQDDIEIVVTNTTERALDFALEVECSGMFSKEGRLDLGEFGLDAEETTTVGFSAADLPIQTRTGVAQLRARAWVQTETEYGDATIRVLSKGLYYHHSSDYSKAAFYDFGTFMEEKNGVLVDPTQPEMGRFRGDNDVFYTVAAGEGSAPAYSIWGHVSGLTIETETASVEVEVSDD